MLKFCITCQSPFKARSLSHKYCNPKCSLDLERNPYTCPNCQAVKHKPHSTDTHACSKYCHDILTMANRIPITCVTCDNEFYVKPQHQDKVFCSVKCRNKYDKLYDQERIAISNIRTKSKEILQEQHLNQLEDFVKQLNS